MTNMDSIQRILSKHHGVLGALLFIIVVFFTHAPFFIYLPIPGISMDTFNYYWFAYEIHLGKLPVIDQPHDFPYGYPLFLWCVHFLGGNIVNVVFLQTTIYVLAGIWLIIHFSKYVSYGGLISLLGLTLFTVQPYTINHNLRLLMESPYTSGLFFLAGSTVWFLRNKSVWSFSFVLMGVWWLMLMRSNGVLMTTIPLLLIIYAYFNGIKYKVFIPGLIFFLAVNVSGNYFFKDRLSFGDSKRMAGVIEKLMRRYGAVDKKTHVAYISNPDNHRTTSMARRYFLNVLRDKPSFYYSILKTNYSNIITQKLESDTSLRMMDGRYNVDAFAPGLKAFIFNDFKSAQYDSPASANLTEYEHHPRNKWTHWIHLSYELLNKSKTSYLIYLGFWLMIIGAVFNKIVLKSSEHVWNLTLMLSWIHLLPLILLPFLHNRFQERYIHVSEFVIYLVFSVGIFHFSKRYIKRSPITQKMILN